MLIDKRTPDLNTFRYSLVQYDNILTGELFNLGVVMELQDGHLLHLPEIPRQVFNCLDLGESLSGVNYSLSLIHERLDDFGKVHVGHVSNIIKITEQKSYNTALHAEATLEHLVKKFISIKKLREKTAHSSGVRYGKMQIIRSMKEACISEPNLRFHQHIEGMANIVDAAYIKDNLPVSVAQITSPHIKDFYDKIAGAAFTLGEVAVVKSIRDKFIYAPQLTTLGRSDTMKLDQAVEMAKEMGIDVIVRKQHEAVLERLRSAA